VEDNKPDVDVVVTEAEDEEDVEDTAAMDSEEVEEETISKKRKKTC